MEKFILNDDLKVFGVEVKTFPIGIQEAFDGIVSKLPPAEPRTYYGLSTCTKDGISYIAAAAETFEGEGEKYGYTSYLVEKGEYLAVTVLDWLKKTDSIKHVFEQMFSDTRADRTKPCVEIYKNDEEMLCLVKSAG
jgi:hypothetical protein